MHFGMAYLVDSPVKLWHFRAWGQSIKAASGDNAYARDKELLIAGDIVAFKLPTEKKSMAGRVYFIGRDYFNNTKKKDHGRIILIVQPVTMYEHIYMYKGGPETAQVLADELSTLKKDPFLLENLRVKVPVNLVNRRLTNIVICYTDTMATMPDTYYVRYILNTSKHIVRSAIKLHPTREELEVAHHSREHLKKMFTRAYSSSPSSSASRMSQSQSLSPSNTIYSIPYILFVDGFNIYRNNYRSLKGFYIIPANLPYNERRKIANNFTLFLESHGVSMDDIVHSFTTPIRDLN